MVGIDMPQMIGAFNVVVGDGTFFFPVFHPLDYQLDEWNHVYAISAL